MIQWTVNHDRRNADFASPYLSAHNVYYVKWHLIANHELIHQSVINSDHPLASSFTVDNDDL